MKAFVVEHYGKDGLRAADVPEPEVGDGDVLVKVSAAGINPLDTMVRNGEFKRRYQSLRAERNADAAKDQSHVRAAHHRRAKRHAVMPTAATYTSSGNSACSSAYVPMTRRSAPPASVTASVVRVAMRPLPANTVGRYCPTLTAKPIAQAINTGPSSNGKRTRKKMRDGDAPRLAAVRA